MQTREASPAELLRDNQQLYQRLQQEKAARLRAEEALRQAEDELARLARITSMGEFAASIAHEVNQPLAAIVLNAEAGLRLLRQDAPQLEQARDAFRLIVHAGATAGDIVRSIRGMACKARPEPTLFAVDEAVREVLRLLRAELQKHSIQVNDHLALERHQLCADRVQLQQVMMNLVLNAIEAMKDVSTRPRSLTLRSTLVDTSGTLRISVEDNGVGVAAKLAEKLYDPLFSTKPGGTGLGLSICRSIVQAHGGRIWSTSRQPHGAAFHITMKDHTPWTPSPS